ncbi:type II CAAX endopeptidase family protein [Limnoraphis robusta Tam1]|uniref:CPBP family intramembrane glutamic endopeptidase n=1 Tax=Limnoraphis robusta TaxID=1118279 RepID=UPI002B1EA8D3|nr:type II CAAX endopeptidase family protein [Limnoraphis robusta]MEA5537532.1 type II CAAX endopeptidase family protein [Limnoraphis robusta Tam1]
MNLTELLNAGAIIKVTLFFWVWGLLWLPIAIGTAIALNWHPPQPLNEKQKSILLASLYLMVPLIIWNISKVEHQSFLDYGWVWQAQTGISLMIGWSLAILSLIVLFGVEWVFGWMNWHPHLKPTPAIIGTALSILLLAFWISTTEEFVFRGFVQYQLQQDYAIIISAAITSLIFAVTHLIWQVREAIPQLPGLWLMGIVLTLACVCDQGQLGLAIGLHAGLIWGMTSLQTLGRLTYSRRVPQWVTGIADQPLAGAMGIVMLLMVAALLWTVYPKA